MLMLHYNKMKVEFTAAIPAWKIVCGPKADKRNKNLKCKDAEYNKTN